MVKPLYTPFKTIGYISDSIPFQVNKLGDEIFITNSIGNSFQVGCNNCSKLRGLNSLIHGIISNFLCEGVQTRSPIRLPSF